MTAPAVGPGFKWINLERTSRLQTATEPFPLCGPFVAIQYRARALRVSSAPSEHANANEDYWMGLVSGLVSEEMGRDGTDRGESLPLHL